MLKNFVFTNKLGEQLVIDGVDLKSVDGLDLSGLENQLTYTETNFDGAYLQNERLSPRTISMELHVRRRSQEEYVMDERRRNIYSILNPKKNPIRISFNNDLNQSFYIDFYLSNIPIMASSKSENNAAFQRLLVQGLALDPYIYSFDSVSQSLRETVPGWEFEWEIKEDNTILSSINAEARKSIFVGGTNSVGFEAEITILQGGIPSVTIENVTYGKMMTLEIPNAYPGLKYIFSTERGNKRVLALDGPITSDVTNFLTFDSEFFQLEPGDNDIKVYTGITNYADCTISFRNKYTGV